jgi:hypothetical protein
MMNVHSATDSRQAFHASREAAAARLKDQTVSDPAKAQAAEKSLTQTPRPVDPRGAAQAVKSTAQAVDGPVKGRNFDQIA